MLRRLFAVIALVAGMSITAAITLATPALAKGPSQARIAGPGLAHAIVISGQGEPGQPGMLSALAAQTGLFTVMFGTNAIVPAQPRPWLPRTPPLPASLGLRYAITYTVPGVTPQPGEQYGHVRQDLYPRAVGGPVIYTPPGQQGFSGPLQVTGWLRASPRLLRTLALLGVPARAGLIAAARARPSHAAHPEAAHQGSDALPWPIASAAALAAVALAGVVLRLRHRTSPGRGAADH
jgi:hypothetical protein